MHLEGKVLTMGPPGKSPDLLSLENFLKSDFHLNVDLNLFSSFKYVLTCNWKIFIEQVFGFFFFFLNLGSCRYVIGGLQVFISFQKEKGILELFEKHQCDCAWNSCDREGSLGQGAPC